MRSNPLRNAIRLAMGGMLAASLTLPAAVAQEAQEEEARELDRVRVTGSRIRGIDIEDANPVTTFDRADLERTQAANLGELLQRMSTENTGSPVNTRVNNGGNGSVGIDLRGFGRTLTLINGRRPLTSDFQNIPTAMIERVEILKTGASAVYGVDAVAGVVNVITREGFTGAEFNYSYRSYQNADNDAASTRVGGIFGIENARGYANLGFEFTEQDPITQGDLSSGPAFYGQPYNYFNALLGGGPDSWNGFNLNDPYLIPVGSSRTPDGVFDLASGGTFSTRPGTDGTDPNSDFYVPDLALFSPTNDLYNYAPPNFLQTPFETDSVFGHAAYEINPYAETYGEFRYTHRTSAQRLAPMPYDSSLDPAYPLGGGVEGISANNVYNPFGEDVVRVRRRVVEGERRFEQNVNYFQTVLGVRGQLPGTTGWFYDLSYNYGSNERTDIDHGQFIGARLADALGPSFINAEGDPTCGTPGNEISGCVPLNLFGGPGSITQDMLDYVSKPLVDSYRDSQAIWNLTIDGDIVELPAGVLGGAFGIENRQNSSFYTPDSNKAIDGVSGNTGDGIGGTTEVDSFYAEFNIPLVRDVVGVESLTARAAYRYDDFTVWSPNNGVTGFDSGGAKEFGIKYRPIEDIMIRATLADVFTSPSVGDLFSPLVDNFPQVGDPCAAGNWAALSSAEQQACINQGVPAGGVNNPDPQPRSSVGGNPNLEPESGDTTTYGIVYSPSQVEGLTMSVDFWEIDLGNTIASLGAQTILEQCMEEGGTGGVCDRIDRNHPSNPGEIFRITDTLTNIGTEYGSGWDFGINYNFGTGFGQWTVGMDWSHLDERTAVEVEGEEPTVFQGRFNNDRGESFPEDQANIYVDWAYGNFRAGAMVQHMSEVESRFLYEGFGYAVGTQTVPDQQYLDLSFSYLMDNTTATLGIDNVTDEYAPFIEAGFNANTDPQTYRPFGQIIWVNVKHEF